jgi:hypothetical protein
VTTTLPALNTDESTCVRGVACEVLIANGICERALAAVRETITQTHYTISVGANQPTDETKTTGGPSVCP